MHRAFFPGYVFTRVTQSDGRLNLPMVPELVRIVGAAGQPLAIPDSEISAVAQMVKLPSALPHQPVAGDLVLVRRGPLAGIEGVVIRVKNSTRIVVSVGLLRQGVSAEVDSDSLEVMKRAA